MPRKHSSRRGKRTALSFPLGSPAGNTSFSSIDADTTDGSSCIADVVSSSRRSTDLTSPNVVIPNTPGSSYSLGALYGGGGGRASYSSPSLVQQHHGAGSELISSHREIRSIEPDVTVVVGGVEFFHHTAVLVYASEYFDTCLSSGMKESQLKRIEFPDRDPEEWKFVYSFLEPDATTIKRPSISTKNIPMLLPWFDFLGLGALMKRTDLYLKSKVEKHRSFVGDDHSKNILDNFDQYMNWWDLCQHYDLSHTLIELDAFFGAMILAYPLFFTKEVVSRLKPCLLYVREIAADTGASAGDDTDPDPERQERTVRPSSRIRGRSPAFGGAATSYYGNALWDAMVESDFIPADLLGRLTREEIIQSPTFADMVEAKIMCQKYRYMSGMGDMMSSGGGSAAAPRTPSQDPTNDSSTPPTSNRQRTPNSSSHRSGRHRRRRSVDK